MFIENESDENDNEDSKVDNETESDDEEDNDDSEGWVTDSDIENNQNDTNVNLFILKVTQKTLFRRIMMMNGMIAVMLKNQKEQKQNLQRVLSRSNFLKLKRKKLRKLKKFVFIFNGYNSLLETITKRHIVRLKNNVINEIPKNL